MDLGPLGALGGKFGMSMSTFEPSEVSCESVNVPTLSLLVVGLKDGSFGLLECLDILDLEVILLLLLLTT